jgi:hypothetical protein
MKIVRPHINRSKLQHTDSGRHHRNYSILIL